jgi:hypothetical protein
MNTTTIAQTYTKLSDQLGKETTENLMTFIGETFKEDLYNATKELATKNDIAATNIKIAETKAELIKWMFIFWAGQLAAMFGLLYFFIKK